MNKILFFIFVLGFVGYFHFLGSQFININQFSSLNVKNSYEFKSKDPYSRVYFVRNSAPQDQYFGLYMQAFRQNDFFSAQGLYWESSKTSHIAESYDSILFHENVGVVDHLSMLPSSCAVEACLLDRFFQEFNIGTLVVDPSLKYNTLPPFQRLCLQGNLDQQKTTKNNFLFIDTMEQSYPELNKNLKMNIYQIESKSPTVYENNSPVEIAYPEGRVVFYDPKEKFYFKEYFLYENHICEKTQQNSNMEMDALFLPKELSSMHFSFASSKQLTSMSQIQFEKIKRNEYRVQIDSKDPVWFKIKLSYFPGLKLLNSKGQTLPLYPGISYSLAHGNGEMKLVYERPTVFLVSYVVSTFSLLLFILLLAPHFNFARRNSKL